MSRGAKHKVRRQRRSAGLAVAAAAAIPLIALPLSGFSATAVAAEFSYFPTEPTRVLTLSLLPGGNDDDLSGVMCESPRTCQNLVYSRANQTAAVAKLDAAVRDGTTGKQIIFAYSQGARVAGRWLRENGGTEGAPTADELSFVLMGNPGRKYGGSDRDWETTFPTTDYHVIDVSQQYDMASDFPDNPFNLLALLNANAGFFFTHQDYETVDIYSEANYVWTEGNTTYVFVPTENLPLLQPLRWLGLGALADALNGPLKEIVESAYDRSYLPAQPGLPTTPEPEPVETQTVSNPVQSAQTQLTSVRTESADAAKVRTETRPDEVIDHDDTDDAATGSEADLDLDGTDADDATDPATDLTDDDATDLADDGADADADADDSAEEGADAADDGPDKTPNGNGDSPANDE